MNPSPSPSRPSSPSPSAFINPCWLLIGLLKRRGPISQRSLHSSFCWLGPAHLESGVESQTPGKRDLLKKTWSISRKNSFRAACFQIFLLTRGLSGNYLLGVIGVFWVGVTGNYFFNEGIQGGQFKNYRTTLLVVGRGGGADIILTLLPHYC